MFVLLSALTANPLQIFPILRADTAEALQTIIEAESVTDTVTGAISWNPTSKLAVFVHPQEVVANGKFPVQAVGTKPNGKRKLSLKPTKHTLNRSCRSRPMSPV